MRVNVRSALLVTTLLTGCTGFHPLDPPWRRAAADATGGTPPPDAAPALEWQAIGWSHEGRPLRVTRLGKGPRKVLFVGGIHGDEREGRIAAAELPRTLAGIPGALDEVTLVLLEDVNPDGTAQDTRGNSRGVDLNRNYPAENFQPSRFFGFEPLDQPESRALHDLVLREEPDLVIVLHSWRGDHFINYDGPAKHLAERFASLSSYRVRASTSISPTPGSLGSWVGIQLGIPILTLEYERGREPWAAWSETKDAILSVIRAD